MKKALAMALGAVLAAGSAAPASAASQVDFSGFYGAHYVVNGNLGYTGDDNLNESFFEERFNVNVTFQATDEVSVVWRFRAPADRRWGTANAGLSTRYVYGQVVQDWGTVRVGRLAGGLANEFGLSSLGWAPGLDNEFTSIKPFESAGDADSIQYANTWDNGFGLVATYSKITDEFFDNDWEAGGWTENIGSDHDADRYQIQGAYMWDGGGIALNTYYLRDATGNGDGPARGGSVTANGLADKTTAWFINPAIMHSWGAFSVHAEGMFVTGTTSYNDNAGPVAKADTDLEGQGFYLDFDYNYGPGRVNLAGWWVSGNDIDDNGNKDKSWADIVDGNFYPLVVAYGPANANAYYTGPSYHANRGQGAVGVANSADFLTGGNKAMNDLGVEAGSPGRTAITAGGPVGNRFATVFNPARDSALGNNGQANHWALMVSGQHAFTDEITFNYALAYMALTNPNYKAVEQATYNGSTGNWGAVGYSTQDKNLGWEIDLGVNVQLLDNLAFTSTVGYMFTGDAYKRLKGYRVSDTSATDGSYTARAEWEDADDAYSWMNSLTFSF